MRLSGSRNRTHNRRRRGVQPSKTVEHTAQKIAVERHTDRRGAERVDEKRDAFAVIADQWTDNGRRDVAGHDNETRSPLFSVVTIIE